MSDKQTEALVSTVVTVANITDSVFNVMREVAGNEISSSINGTKVSKEVLSGLVQNRIRTKLAQ
jgi:hypothetical protein